jgi:hypothetical protein
MKVLRLKTRTAAKLYANMPDMTFVGLNTSIVERTILKLRLNGPQWLMIPENECERIPPDSRQRETTARVEIVVDSEFSVWHACDWSYDYDSTDLPKTVPLVTLAYASRKPSIADVRLD